MKEYGERMLRDLKERKNILVHSLVNNLLEEIDANDFKLVERCSTNKYTLINNHTIYPQQRAHPENSIGSSSNTIQVSSTCQQEGDQNKWLNYIDHSGLSVNAPPSIVLEPSPSTPPFDDWTVTSPKDPFFVSNAKPSLDSMLDNVLNDKVLTFKEQELLERKDEALFPPTFVNVKSKKNKKKPIAEQFHQDAKQIMKDGMKIPFVATSPTGYQRKTSVRNNIPEERESYIDEKIKDYVDTQVLVKIQEEEVEFAAGISLVARKNDPSNDREIMDFTYLNKFITRVETRHIGFSDILSAVKAFQFGATIDLKSCFTQIPLHPSSRKYCCIYWRGQYYQFTRVPFGISCAPAACQLVTSSILQGSSIKHLVHLDDFLLLNSSPTELVAQITEATDKITATGFPINIKKSLLTPNCTLEYFGWSLDFLKQEIRLPQKKQQELRVWVKRFRDANYSCSYQDWQRFIGVFSAHRTRVEDENIKDFFFDILKGAEPSQNIQLGNDRIKLSFIRIILSSSKSKNFV